MEKPSWLPNPDDYRREPKIDSGARYLTTAIRGQFAIQVVYEDILPLHPKAPRILEVGVGIEGPYFDCPYEPYMISAALGAAGVNYRLDIVDLNQRILNDLRGRQKIFLPYYHYTNYPDHRDAWDRYLKHTGQLIKASAYISSLMRLTEQATDEEKRQQQELMIGKFLLADVPRTFIQRVRQGNTRLIQGDVALVNLREKYSLVSCCNVLYLLPETGQKLAMYNLAQSLKNGGYLVITDIAQTNLPLGKKQRIIKSSPILDYLGGWLTADKMADLGLEMSRVLDEEEGGNLIVSLKKVAS